MCRRLVEFEEFCFGVALGGSAWDSSKIGFETVVLDSHKFLGEFPHNFSSFHAPFGTFNVKANLMITIMLALMTENCIL